MKDGELRCILQYFSEKKSQWPEFNHSEQRDVEERTTNIFWCNEKMQVDYEVFGDVVTFDTTYETNKEFRPVGVFVGVNNHKQMIIFGTALIYDKTLDSFKWLFNTFLMDHKQKKLMIISTDQDQAMMNALQHVILEAKHGLCMWHINKNVGSN